MDTNIPATPQDHWALVTGASSGIGKAFAEALAKQGMSLVLVALEKDLLDPLSRQWEQEYKIRAIPLALDLTKEDSLSRIQQVVTKGNISISTLVNAAGFGYFGEFDTMPAARVRSMIQLNALAVAELCRLFLPGMKARKKGVIVNITSVAGFLPYPFAAVYCATKSFVRLLTEALWAENRQRQVRILLLCPGYTKSNFEKVSTEPDTVHLFPGENPEDIARKTLAQIERSRCIFFTKQSHVFKIFAAKLLPRKVFAAILRHLLRKAGNATSTAAGA